MVAWRGSFRLMERYLCLAPYWRIACWDLRCEAGAINISFTILRILPKSVSNQGIQSMPSLLSTSESRELILGMTKRCLADVNS